MSFLIQRILIMLLLNIKNIINTNLVTINTYTLMVLIVFILIEKILAKLKGLFPFIFVAHQNLPLDQANFATEHSLIFIVL